MGGTGRAARSSARGSGGAEAAAMEGVLEAKLRRWADLGEAPEYYELARRGPYKQTIVSELNRFGGQMGPYADSLLPLQSVEYINASPIDNLGENVPGFVATMCPKRSTFAHFWSMVWEIESQLVVNLTHERDKVGSEASDKREQYWPPYDERMAREAAQWPVRVRNLGCESCEQVPGLLRYAIELTGPGEQKRLVMLYWYSRWLDFPASSSIGTQPFFDNAWNVLRVAIHLSALLTSTLRPRHRTVCHCSAGVGRTGTLIALLRLLVCLPTLQNEQQFDSFVRETIELMRERRLWMVKTDVEYALLYGAILLRLRNPSEEMFNLSWRLVEGDISAMYTLLNMPLQSTTGTPVLSAVSHSKMDEEEIDNARDISHYNVTSHSTPPLIRSSLSCDTITRN